MLRIDPQDAVPIWKQIEEGLRHLIARGALGPDDAVPSVRELSRELRVNPLTVSKAYRHLVDAGTLVVRRGEGTYVASHPPVMSDGARDQKLALAARRFVSLAKTLGVSSAAAHALIQQAWSELGPLESEVGDE